MIHESLKQTYHVSWFTEDGAEYPVRVFIFKDIVTIGLDTSGISLHKRGYRKLVGKAPISETLASALIMLTPWNKDRVLVDPFCGSGTFPIEAAMIGARIAPGIDRDFLASEWAKVGDKKMWYNAIDEANDMIDHDVKMNIQGYDLDNEMVTWLEDFLRSFKGVVIMVTHDRYFLDRVTNKILEISHGGLYAYEANYSKFLELKAEREEMELASERKRQSVLRMELEWAKRGCRARSTKQRARLERLEALKNGKAPVRDANVELDSVETRMGKKTIELHHISKSFGEKKILDDFNYIVLRNQRLGIIGPNGCGKSTLIKIIDGMIQPDAGEVEIGETIRIGYFAQEVPDMDTNQRVIDYIRDVAEYIPTRDGKISATMMLERFLFDSAMQYAPIAKLSGGEKRRLYLLKVLMEAPNVLLLDEPSNDLDIPTLTILEDYLDSFAGIVIAVSHDRYFLDNIVDRIFAFEGNGHLTQYEGGYTDYTEALARKGGAVSEGQSNAVGAEKKKSAQADWKQNRPQKLKFTYKEQREFETIDDDIAALEELLEKLDKDMEANATNSVKLREIMEQKEKAQADLDEKMDRWVYLNDLAERIEAQKSEK